MEFCVHLIESCDASVPYFVKDINNNFNVKDINNNFNNSVFHSFQLTSKQGQILVLVIHNQGTGDSQQQTICNKQSGDSQQQSTPTKGRFGKFIAVVHINCKIFLCCSPARHIWQTPKGLVFPSIHLLQSKQTCFGKWIFHSQGFYYIVYSFKIRKFNIRKLQSFLHSWGLHFLCA